MKSIQDWKYFALSLASFAIAASAAIIMIQAHSKTEHILGIVLSTGIMITIVPIATMLFSYYTVKTFEIWSVTWLEWHKDLKAYAKRLDEEKEKIEAFEQGRLDEKTDSIRQSQSL